MVAWFIRFITYMYSVKYQLTSCEFNMLISPERDNALTQIKLYTKRFVSGALFNITNYMRIPYSDVHRDRLEV